MKIFLNHINFHNNFGFIVGVFSLSETTELLSCGIACNLI